MKVGFIGLGNMGEPMARNLAAANIDIAGYDIVRACPEGVKSASSAVDAAANRDVVITMLPDGEAVKSVAVEILPAMKSGAILLDCSTVDIDSALEVYVSAKTANLRFVDAPVSGGVGGAVAGSLTFMAGGAEDDFKNLEPLFDIMGSKAVHCGEAGTGQIAKICNNMILGATMIVTCEAFALADRLGLSRERMFEVVSTSSGYSWSMNAYCPVPSVGPTSPADNGYRPGFAADLMLKDLRLAQIAAASASADTPVGRLANDIYESFVENEGGSGKDFSAIFLKFAEKL
ncbi:MAG: 3-hydroxyisobutyrate dehydrogenase [Albidovulum sp.]|nr:3-hydroxyisobutyrate dehydrogenase [Albidovulum sp.]MDE0532900.1 3-hydroxyisobutyrate dehydrogenase [Albidovulum sp.]